jgi:hypothetical protein
MLITTMEHGEMWFSRSQTMHMLKTTFMSCAVAAALLGCTPKTPGVTTTLEDKVYSVTPPAMVVKAGIVTAELTEMQITERVEKESGTVETPAKLTAKLKLQNSSPDQTVRLISGNIVYVDQRGEPIKVEEARSEPVIRFATGTSSQLDPGQDSTQSINVDFPASALRAQALKEIRLDLIYTPTAFRRESGSLPVRIGQPEPMASAAK